MKTVTLYTDGACSGNPGPGGWGAILMFGEYKKELSGGEKNTTNNRMELTAVIQGLQALKDELTQYAASGKADSEMAYLTERRHFDVIEEARQMLQNALSGVGILPIDLLAADLTEAWKKLGEITGATAPEEVIDEIFDKFCVGK